MTPKAATVVTAKRLLHVANAPTAHRSTMTGITDARGARNTSAATRIIAIPRGHMMMLAMMQMIESAYMLDARSVKSVGPGLRPFMYSTPIAMAVMVSPGMPNSREGTQPEARLALLLAPASINPSGCPVPNFLGSFEKRLDMEELTHAA